MSAKQNNSKKISILIIKNKSVRKPESEVLFEGNEEDIGATLEYAYDKSKGNKETRWLRIEGLSTNTLSVGEALKTIRTDGQVIEEFRDLLDNKLRKPRNDNTGLKQNDDTNRKGKASSNKKKTLIADMQTAKFWDDLFLNAKKDEVERIKKCLSDSETRSELLSKIDELEKSKKALATWVEPCINDAKEDGENFPDLTPAKEFLENKIEALKIKLNEMA